MLRSVDQGRVVAVCSSPRHAFSKQPQLSIRLLAGLGVEGDAHCGETVQHLYLKRRDPALPNRTQVHLIPVELFEDVAAAGYRVAPGDLGENITTQGLDLRALPLGTLLRIGDEAAVELTGLRTPCSKIDRFLPGLLKQVVERHDVDTVFTKAGVMGIVVRSGEVAPGAAIAVELPPEPHEAMQMI
jgi:MOSC domain-containing protein YiiM